MPKTKSWAASEHSRIASEVFPKSIHGGGDEREGAIVRNASFGLAKVRLPSTTSRMDGKSASLHNALRPARVQPRKQHPDIRDGSIVDKLDDERISSLVPVRVGCLGRWRLRLQRALHLAATSEFLWLLFGFLDSLYILVAVPLRFGFFFDPWNELHRRTTWTFALTLFSAIDALFCVLRVVNSRKVLQTLLRNSVDLCCFRVLQTTNRESSVFRAWHASMTADNTALRSVRNDFSVRGDRVTPFDTVPVHRDTKATKVTLRAMWLETLYMVTYVVPWETLCAGLNYNWIHLAGTMRFPHAVYNLPKQFRAVFFTHLRESKLAQRLSFSTVAITVYLFVVGMYLCHVAAAGYIFVAHWRCGLEFTQCTKYPLPQAWVLRDNLERGSKVRKYVRTLYWACKSVVTLGQGDLIPVTNSETLYRVIVQFVCGLWATAILTAYSFFFSHKDAGMTTNICTRRQQAAQFLAARKLPVALAANVRTYFQYMDRTRNGVEEDLILSNLPPHYRTKCSHYVKYKCFRRITMFKNRQGAFLRTVLSLLEKDFFAPNQVVLQLAEPEEMLIVAAGEIRITGADGAVHGRLTPGNAYAEYALYDDHVATNQLTAETYCELWCLSKRAFKVALRKHFSKLMYASILGKKIGLTKPTAVASGTHNLELAARLDSFADMETSARMMKVVGNGSTVKNKMVQRLTNEVTSAAQRVPAWRQLNSVFRDVWACLECALLLLLIAEVPHQIAFQRGFGLLNAVDDRSFGAVPFVVQQADFGLTLGVELFFYADLYFRARCFARPALSRREQKEEDEHSNMHAVATIVEPAQIFRHYVENDRYGLDAIALAPIALVWDVLPKHWFTPRTVQCLRFFRALRLLRVRKLHTKLRTLMLAYGWAQYSRLLVYIVVGAVSAAHIAGCVFFLVADMDVFHGGLPISGVASASISTPQCLEDASRYGNCTWYMFDRSMFNIDAPYLRSLHWSLVLLSTVGYGDIMPLTTKECVTGCVWIFVSANICYFTSSALSSAVAQVNILDSIRHDREEELNLALASMPASVTECTKTALRSYYETKWKLNGSAVHDEEVVAHLPRSLRRLVLRALFFDDLDRCPLFASDARERDALLQQLAQVARCEIFLRNAFVIREGHLATEFFVIQSGDAEKLLPALRTIAVDLDKDAPLRTARRLSGAYSRRSVRLTMKKLTPLSVDNAMTKLSSRTLFQKSRSSPSAIHLRQRSQRADTMRFGCDTTPPPTFVQTIGSGSLDATSGPALPSLRASTFVSRPSLWRIGIKSLAPTRADDDTIFVSVLKKGDYFGEESLAPRTHSDVYQISVRVFSTVQAVVVRRADLLALLARFPTQSHLILDRRRQQAMADDVLLKKLRTNFFFKPKLRKWLGATDSLRLESNKQADMGTAQQKHHAASVPLYQRVVDPEAPFAFWWHRIVGAVLVYNFYVVVFRIAFLPYPSHATMRWLTAVDYASDALLYIDIYLKHEHMGYVEYGQKVLDRAAIRRRYRRGWFVFDCVSMLPLFVQGDFFYMTAARAVRLVRSPQLATLLDDVHTQIQQRFLKGDTVLANVFDLVRFVLIFVSTAHYIGSMYYLLGRLQLETGLVTTSWVNSDLILDQYPDDPLVHYMRSMYWCISTFTVDCFGDIWARNFLEVCFAGFTCVLGWIFVGQVIGRINTLMVTLNQEAKARHERVEDFEQYAKQRRLPPALWQRAMQSLAFKSECLLTLGVADVFRDLPTAMRAQLFFEMYGPIFRRAPVFDKFTTAQLEAVANVLYVEIYLHGDVIFEAGRAGSKLYILKTGVGEVFAPTTGIVFAALEPGALFGEFSFFIPTATHLASARAVRSCQVLQLERRKWDAIWPRAVRHEIEAALLPSVKARYVQTSKVYMHISKNLYTKNEKAVPPLSRPLRVPKLKRKSLKRTKVHPAPSEAQVPDATQQPRKMRHDVKPTAQRRSFSVETTMVQSLVSPTSGPRRRTMLGRTNSKLGRIRNELGRRENQINGVETALPESTSTSTSTSELASKSTTELLAVATETQVELLDPPTRTLSSTDVFEFEVSKGNGDELMLEDANEAEGMSLRAEVPEAAATPGLRQDGLYQRQDSSTQYAKDTLARDEEEKDAFVRKLSLSSFSAVNNWTRETRALTPTRTVADDDVPMTSFSVDDLRISLASEAKWKRHYKRLQGIKTFAEGIAAVRRVVEQDATALFARRHSIAVLPSYEDSVAAQDEIVHARLGLDAYFPVRRHSVQGDAKEIAAALLTMDEFEDKMTVELPLAPAPPPSDFVRMTTPMLSIGRRHISTYSSTNSRRYSAAAVRAEATSPPLSATLDTLRGRRATAKAAAPAAVSWWRQVSQWVSRKTHKQQQQSQSHRSIMPIAPNEYVSSVRQPPDSRYQIWKQPAAVSPMFLQHSAFRHGWEIAMLAVTLYYLFVIPFRIGFLHQYLTDPVHVVAVEVWFLLEYVLCDVPCVVDLVLQRRYFAFLEHGEVVSDPDALAAHYWAHGSFVVDALSIVPLELLAVVGVYALTPPPKLATGAAAMHHPPQTLWHALSLLRINRFLRGVHLHALLDRVQHYVLYDLKLTYVRPSLLYLLRLGLDFAFGTHWIACLFYGVSYLTFDAAQPSWLTAPGMLQFEGCASLYDVAHVPVAVAYLRSFHFSIGAVTTVCYGDILPMNAVENSVTLGVIFLSVALFSILSGGFFKLFEHALGKRAQYEERVAQVGHYMVFHQFPSRTWQQMQAYFALSWQESKGMHEEHMLRGLSTSVRHEIALHVHANLIKHVKLFARADEPFARAVVVALKHELFVRNDVIIQRGDMSRNLYIIETGLVSICVVRNLYMRGSTTTGDATVDAATSGGNGSGDGHRSSVTEWVGQTAMSLADAQRAAAAGVNMVGDNGIAAEAAKSVGLAASHDISSTVRKACGRKVAQREEKFVKGPFDYFGERSLLFGTPRNATCIALCICSLFVLTVERFDAILDEFPTYRSKCMKIWVMNRNLSPDT